MVVRISGDGTITGLVDGNGGLLPDIACQVTDTPTGYWATYVYDMDTDEFGNIYTIWDFDIDSVSANNYPVVTRHNSDGTLIWAKKLVFPDSRWPSRITYSSGSVVVTVGNGPFVRLDPATGAVLASADINSAVDAFPFDGGFFAASGRRVLIFDPSFNVLMQMQIDPVAGGLSSWGFGHVSSDGKLYVAMREDSTNDWAVLRVNYVDGDATLPSNLQLVFTVDVSVLGLSMDNTITLGEDNQWYLSSVDVSNVRLACLSETGTLLWKREFTVGGIASWYPRPRRGGGVIMYKRTTDYEAVVFTVDSAGNTSPCTHVRGYTDAGLSVDPPYAYPNGLNSDVHGNYLFSFSVARGVDHFEPDLLVRYRPRPGFGKEFRVSSRTDGYVKIWEANDFAVANEFAGTVAATASTFSGSVPTVLWTMDNTTPILAEDYTDHTFTTATWVEL